MRHEAEAKKPYKVTLKFRAPDRYTAAGCDARCTEEVDVDDVKFEEDVVPPFASKFAYSVSFKAKTLPPLATMADLAALFPGLAALAIPTNTPIQMVNGFQAHEVVHFIGKLILEKMPVARAAFALPDFVVKVALSHWYLRPDENDYPLVTELSFGFDADSQQADNHLEKFPPTVVAGANRLFRDVQNQAGRLAQFGSTKTAYVFEVL